MSSIRTYHVTLERDWIGGRWATVYTADLAQGPIVPTDMTLGVWEIRAANRTEALAAIAEYLLRRSLGRSGMAVVEMYVKQLDASVAGR